jgi:acetyl esterase/lipase
MPVKTYYAVPFAVPDAKTDHIVRKMFDLPFGSLSPAQKVDIYWPEDGNGPFPVILVIHGGAFMGGDKRDIQLPPMLEALNHGYAVVSMNYRMSGDAIFPALVQDVRAANPETYIRPGLPPFFIQHGKMDDTVPFQQSLNFARKLAAIAPEKVTHEILPNARNADPAFETPQNIQKVLDFIARVLRS